jgi:hypothetical protein
MTITNNPGSVQRTDAPNTHGVAADAQPTRVNRPARGSETTSFFKTAQFIVFILLLGLGDRRERRLQFRADKALRRDLSVGLAKSGSRHHDDA